MTKSEAIKAFAKRGKSPSNLTDWERGDSVSAGNQKISASTAKAGFDLHLPAKVLSKVA